MRGKKESEISYCWFYFNLNFMFKWQVSLHISEIFLGRWIGRGCPIYWPPRFPDLTTFHFCLWGWMKNEVYTRQVNTWDELLARVLDTAARIKEHEDRLRRTTSDLRTRVVKCIDGGICEHLSWTEISLSFLCSKYGI